MLSNDYMIYTKISETEREINKIETKITKVNDALIDIKLNTRSDTKDTNNIESIKVEYTNECSGFILLQGLEEDLMEIVKEINKSKKKVGKSKRKLNKDKDNKYEKCLDYIMVEINYKDTKTQRYIITQIASNDFI